MTLKFAQLRISAIVWICLLSFAFFPQSFAQLSERSSWSFNTGGHTVYHLECGKLSVESQAVLFTAASDGTVMCFTQSGKKLWENTENRAFPFDFDVADFDGDDNDEAVLASADGTLYAYDHEGQVRWKFSQEAPLLQVASAVQADGTITILTGGNERKLYALSANGELLATREFDHVVRHVRTGDIFGNGKPYAAVVTARSPSTLFNLHVIDAETLRDVWPEPVTLTNASTPSNSYQRADAGIRVPVYSMLVSDLNADGQEEIALAESTHQRGVFRVYNAQGEWTMTSSSKGVRTRAYCMNILGEIRVGTAQEKRIAGLIGNQLILYHLDGSIDKILAAPYSFASHVFDPRTKTLFFGSSITGGDGIYALRTDKEGWEQAFANLQPEIGLARIENNIEILNQQIESFERPDYQPDPRQTTVLTKNLTERAPDTGQQLLEETFLNDFDYQNVTFAAYYTRSEDYDRSLLPGGWPTKVDHRRSYSFSAEEIIAFAQERESRKEPFGLWAGHGHDAFIIQLPTLEKVLKTAPTMLKALVYAELERLDTDMQYAMETHLIPLAKLCREQGTTKIVLRNKNVFWNASIYEGFWRERLLNGEYGDVFVPSMEETNCRTQAISLSGRQGLWLLGKFDTLSSRAVTDNANFGRFWEWGAQQFQTHHVRKMALQASLGADLFLVNIYQGDERDVAPFYQMVDKGVIAIPGPQDILSLSEVCLGMREPSEYILEHGRNGHHVSNYGPGESDAVFSRLDTYWAGSPVPETDFSHYAMGSQSRRYNFLPTNPYGLIATIPAGTDISTDDRWKYMLITDGEFFYDEDGQAISAADSKVRVEALLETSAEKLPIRVQGDVAWSVVRLGPNHVRILLIDSGYLEPAEREAQIMFQHLDAVWCRDILSGELLEVTDNQIKLTVPAAILRVVDIEHR